MAHEDIRILFTVDGNNFEAVGYLKDGEKSIDSDELFQRVPNAIGDKDDAFLRSHIEELPAELRQYRLITTQRKIMRYWRGIRLFGWSAGKWHRNWYRLGLQCYSSDLVLRRCA